MATSDLIEEFRRQPIGRHSPELRLLLNNLRRGQKGDPYILVCTKPQAKWKLARKPAGRGSAVRLVSGFVFCQPGRGGMGGVQAPVEGMHG